MPRIRLLDRLQVYQFHLMDVSYSLAFPPWALDPLLSFKSITAPEVQLEVEELAEGTHPFKRHLISGGSVSSITLTRGASFYDSEFWRWIVATVKGSPGGPFGSMSGKRRNLLLIQFTGYSATAIGEAGAELQAVAQVARGFLPDVGGILRVPARAWLLMDCLPIRYKSGSDFDASSSEISLMELELHPDRIEEFSITG